MKQFAIVLVQQKWPLTRILLGCLWGATAWLITGCSNPPLHPWHTERLEAEFTTDKLNEIRSLDDYRQLEDRLFEQLQKKVYARTGSGAEYQLNRYSSGSAADPQDRSPDWNRTFELTAVSPAGGVLLLHGMSDSPYSLRTLGKTLNQRNYWVIGLRLPGHGTAPSGLKFITWEDMAAAVRLGIDQLAAKVGQKPIHIVGYSNGAPLAISYSLDALDGKSSPLPASLVLISPAIGVHPAAGLAGVKGGLSRIPGLGSLAWLSVLPEFDPYKYNSFATNAGAQVHRLTRFNTRRIATRAQSGSLEHFPPTLVFKSTVDATVSMNSVVDDFLKHLGPHQHELVLFDINRYAAKVKLLIDDPAPLTDRLMADEKLPFTLTLVTNEKPESFQVIALCKAPLSKAAPETEPLSLAWPTGVISLSHVALPFPPDDPLYGQRPPDNEKVLFLGQMALQGERGLLKIPYDWLLRLRYNPFYDYLEGRTLLWLDNAKQR
jgi:alpha-beta hydrolase superfamily lysophospholipase